MEFLPHNDLVHEQGATNIYQYPIEYFDAQVRFALRWAEVTGESYDDSIRKRTALTRRIDDNLTDETTNSLLHTGDTDNIVRRIYNLYTSQASALYTPEKWKDRQEDFGFFGYDYYPNNQLSGGKNSIKIHFLNSERGAVSGLAPEYLQQRQQDIKHMIRSVVGEHPEADEVIGGSWLYNLPAYRDSFPVAFIASLTPLVPNELADQYLGAAPHMSFRGNSLWGQFIDRRGWVSKSRYEEFVHDVAKATSLLGLYEAFPLKPLQPKCAPAVFLD